MYFWCHFIPMNRFTAWGALWCRASGDSVMTPLLSFPGTPVGEGRCREEPVGRPYWSALVTAVTLVLGAWLRAHCGPVLCPLGWDGRAHEAGHRQHWGPQLPSVPCTVELWELPRASPWAGAGISFLHWAVNEPVILLVCGARVWEERPRGLHLWGSLPTVGTSQMWNVSESFWLQKQIMWSFCWHKALWASLS